MNWGKLTSLARRTFKNPNFKSVCEMPRTSKCSLTRRFKSPNFESVDDWETLCPYLSFTTENKMGNLDKAGHISNLK